MSTESLVNMINKKYKKNIVQLGGDIRVRDLIPFSSPKANYVTRGGIPVGKMVEFFGAEGGGKTTSALDIIKNYQAKFDRPVVYLDAENTLDLNWAENLGVDMSKVIVIKPEEEFGETLLDMVLDFIRSGEVGLVVVDSIPYLISKAVMETELEKKSYAGNSALMTEFCSKAIPLMNKSNTTVLMINQVRDKMGVTYTAYNTPGGHMLRHSYSLRIMYSKGSLLDEDNKEVTNSFEAPKGNLVNMRIEKNKVTKPDRKIGFYTLKYDIGVDILKDTLELAINLGMIVQGGSWFTLLDLDTGEVREDLKFQGKPKMIEWVEGNRDYFDRLYIKVNEVIVED